MLCPVCVIILGIGRVKAAVCANRANNTPAIFLRNALWTDIHLRRKAAEFITWIFFSRHTTSKSRDLAREKRVRNL